MRNEEPTLLFFRTRPDGWKTNATIASSMQSLESSFFLIALGRYPHALSVCASAVESCLQAADVSAKEKDGFQELVKKAKKSSNAVREFDDERLKDFREARNRITHRGFSPHDDSESVALYLEVGLPFLSLCYREFHSFDVMHGLLDEYAEHIGTANKVLALAKAHPALDKSYCLNSFSHLVRWSFKHNFSAGWEIDALLHSEEIGQKFDRTREEKQALEQLFSVSYSFDCPVCGDSEGVVAELEEGGLIKKTVRPIRMACTSCGFVVAKGKPYLSEILLAKQVSRSSARILKEYGIRLS